MLDGVEIHHVWGRGGTKRAAEACILGRIVITTAELPGPADCILFDPTRLARSGSVAIDRTDEGLVIVKEVDLSGQRPWTGTLDRQRDPVDTAPRLIARAQ